MLSNNIDDVNIVSLLLLNAIAGIVFSEQMQLTCK